MKIRVERDMDYCQGHLRGGHFELTVDKELWDSFSKEKKEDYFLDNSVIDVDDYEVDDYELREEDFRIIELPEPQDQLGELFNKWKEVTKIDELPAFLAWVELQIDKEKGLL